MTALPTDDPARGTSGWRGRETVLLYIAYILGAWGLNGLGALLIPLQGEFSVGRQDVAIYPTLYSTGMFVMGTVGAPLVRRLGQHRTILLALAFTLVGVGLMAVPSRLAIGVGAVIFGTAGATTTLILPLRFATLHGRRSGRAVTEANAVGSIGAVIAPLVIAAVLWADWNWRFGYILPLVALTVAVLVAFLMEGAPGEEDAGGVGSAAAGTEPDRTAAETLPLRALLGRWVDIPLAVGVEFSIVFWAATAVTEWHRVETATATVAASGFLLGMAVGRIVGGPMIDRLQPRKLALLGAALGLAGFLLFWAAISVQVSVAGVFVAGCGVAVIYPASITRLVAVDPWNRERASQLGALGLGLAVALSPVVLAWLSGLVGMRWAYAVVPVMLVILVLKNLRPGRGDEQWEDLDPEVPSEPVATVLDEGRA